MKLAKVFYIFGSLIEFLERNLDINEPFIYIFQQVIRIMQETIYKYTAYSNRAAFRLQTDES